MLILLTLTNGQAIYVNPDQIVTVSESPNTKETTVITLADTQTLEVKETIADIAKVVEIYHGDFIGPSYKLARKRLADA